jgi:hypothetical protein
MSRNGHFLITSISITALTFLSSKFNTNEIFYLFNNEYFICISLIFLGSLIPDSDFKLFGWLPQFNKNRYWEYHRQITHSLLIWLPLLVYGYLYNFYIFWACIGVMTHLIPDIITGSIPFLSFWNKGYNDKFPKRIGFKLFGKNGNVILINVLENFSKKGGFVFSLLILGYVYYSNVI